MRILLFYFLLLQSPLLLGQYTDYFESYTPGEPIFVNWWGSWDGTVATAIRAIESTAFNGMVSGHVPANEGISGVLSLGNKTDGLWQLQMYFYIASGSSASWNLQGEVPVAGGASIVGDFLFNDQGSEPGVARITDTSEGEVAFDFPHDEWFFMTLNFNFKNGPENALWGVFINGEPILDNGTPLTDEQGNHPLGLGGVNFVSTNVGDGYLLDRFLFCDTSCLLSNVMADAKVPVRYSTEANGWRIATGEICQKARVYDLRGRLVQMVKPEASDFIISSAALNKGLYVIELQFDRQTQRIKVVH